MDHDGNTPEISRVSDRNLGITARAENQIGPEPPQVIKCLKKPKKGFKYIKYFFYGKGATPFSRRDGPVHDWKSSLFNKFIVQRAPRALTNKHCLRGTTQQKLLT